MVSHFQMPQQCPKLLYKPNCLDMLPKLGAVEPHNQLGGLLMMQGERWQW